MEEKLRRPHTVCLEDRKNLTVTGVTDVGEVTPEGVSAATPWGELHVRGTGLKVIRLDSATGELVISGEIQALSYTEETRSRSWFSRLFR